MHSLDQCPIVAPLVCGTPFSRTWGHAVACCAINTGFIQAMNSNLNSLFCIYFFWSASLKSNFVHFFKDNAFPSLNYWCSINWFYTYMIYSLRFTKLNHVNQILGLVTSPIMEVQQSPHFRIWLVCFRIVIAWMLFMSFQKYSLFCWTCYFSL